MKFWKNIKGECGTMGNDGFVPNSVEIIEDEYNEYVESLVAVNLPKSDIQKLIDYAKLNGWIE